MGEFSTSYNQAWNPLTVCALASWLSGRYGLTIDNLVRAEVCLADGRIVEASEKSNADLFWAIRGAGPWFPSPFFPHSSVKMRLTSEIFCALSYDLYLAF